MLVQMSSQTAKSRCVYAVMSCHTHREASTSQRWFISSSSWSD